VDESDESDESDQSDESISICRHEQSKVLKAKSRNVNEHDNISRRKRKASIRIFEGK
jgi:hypothetical protein